MGIIMYLVLGVAIGFLCWAAIKFVPMPAPFQTALPVVGVVVWIAIGALYMFGGVRDFPLPTWR